LLHGRAAILAKALEMLDAAKEEVVLSVPTLDVDAVDIDTDLRDLSDVVDRILTLKIAKVRVLTADIPEEIQTLLPDSIEVRTRPRVFGIGMVTDARETLIMLAGAGEDKTFLGIYSSHAVFAEIASTYFNSLWKEASPV
jgi:sugar-specific transcriptional regulator TrmB